jgi:urease accessory protein
MMKRFGLLAALLPFVAVPALAHHPMEAMGLEPTALTGLISGLAHPVLGPDHLLFLLVLGLVGWQRSLRSALILLAVGLGGSALGLLVPGLPGMELLVSLSLVLEGLVLSGRLNPALLVPAFALHGYVLSASVLGWEATPIATYFSGLLLSQALLLTISLRLVSRGLSAVNRQWIAGLLVGIGAAFTWSSLVP